MPITTVVPSAITSYISAGITPVAFTSSVSASITTSVPAATTSVPATTTSDPEDGMTLEDIEQALHKLGKLDNLYAWPNSVPLAAESSSDIVEDPLNLGNWNGSLSNDIRGKM